MGGIDYLVLASFFGPGSEAIFVASSPGLTQIKSGRGLGMKLCVSCHDSDDINKSSPLHYSVTAAKGELVYYL